MYFTDLQKCDDNETDMPIRIDGFKCSKCMAIYTNEVSAEECEQGHREPTKIVEKIYRSPSSAYPDEITYRFTEPDRVSDVTYYRDR